MRHSIIEPEKEINDGSNLLVTVKTVRIDIPSSIPSDSQYTLSITAYIDPTLLDMLTANDTANTVSKTDNVQADMSVLIQPGVDPGTFCRGGLT